MPLRRPCVERGCARYATDGTSRCAEHLAALARQRPSTTARGYDAEWRRRTVAVRRAWVAEHGLVCPGWEREAHQVATFSDLCLDHTHGVLCRVCNGVKGATWDKRSGLPHGGDRLVE